MTPPEFSRPERADQIGERERHVTIAADEGERRALARRFGLRAIARLEASFALRREGSAIVAEGRVTGAVTQSCSVTAAPLEAAVDEAVKLRFVEEGGDVSDEIELAADALDTLPIENGVVDLGEAAAETLVLALDPFPRAADAAETLAAAGVLGEEEAGPFGALAGLKRKLEG